MKNPNLSVIVPAYNAESTLARALASVLTQTYPAAEILVVNDGSQDQTSTIANSFGGAVQLIEKKNGGAASARNAALDVAKGDLIAFLDADDYWEPTKLEQQAACFARWPDLVLSASRYFSEEPGTKRITSAMPQGFEAATQLFLTGRRAFEFTLRTWTGTVIIRRKAVGDLRFVSGLEPAEDRDFWFRMISKGPVCFLDTPLSTAVLEPNSLSRSSVSRDCGNMLRVIQRNSHSIPFLARTKWISHTHCRWAALTTDDFTAWKQLAYSLLKWPLPYAKHNVDFSFMRIRILRRLLVSLAHQPRIRLRAKRTRQQ